MAPKVEHLSQENLQAKGVFSWPIWTKEVSTFPYSYITQEQCYILDGEAVITPDAGQPVAIHAGDFVTFPPDLHCTWDITAPIKKHYQFG